MPLGIKKHLGMSHALFCGGSEIRVGQLCKVGGGAEDREANVVVVQEVVEGGEGLVTRGEVGGGGEGGVGIRGGEGDGVFEGEGEEEGGGEGSFEVDVLREVLLVTVVVVVVVEREKTCVFGFGESGEEEVERVVAHGGDDVVDRGCCLSGLVWCHCSQGGKARCQNQGEIKNFFKKI